MDTDNRVAPYIVCLLIWVAKLETSMCCRALKTKLIGALRSIISVHCGSQRTHTVRLTITEQIGLWLRKNQQFTGLKVSQSQAFTNYFATIGDVELGRHYG